MRFIGQDDFMSRMLSTLAETNKHLENIARALSKNVKTETQVQAETPAFGPTPDTTLDLYECTVHLGPDGTIPCIWCARVYTSVASDSQLVQKLQDQLSCVRGIGRVNVCKRPDYAGDISILIHVNRPYFNKNKPMLPYEAIDIIERVRKTNKVERVQYDAR